MPRATMQSPEASTAEAVFPEGGSVGSTGQPMGRLRTRSLNRVASRTRPQSHPWTVPGLFFPPNGPTLFVLFTWRAETVLCAQAVRPFSF